MQRMKRVLLFIPVMIIFILLMSCGSMTPATFYNSLPNETKSKFYSTIDAKKATEEGRCTYLVRGRSYLAPIGFTTYDDVRNAAIGIDEWVTIDGGNAYSLNNFKWNTVDVDGTTQLYVEFDTMLCE